MPQNEHIELHTKRFGRRLDHFERCRKKAAREHRLIATKARKLRGIKAKLYNQKRYTEKAEIRKRIRAHEEKDVGKKVKKVPEGAIPTYLFDRDQIARTKVLTNMIKQKRKEKAGKWEVPIPKVRALAENEMFQVLRSGKRKKKQWKKRINHICFVDDNFTRKPPKYERFIRPTGLRFKFANVTHPELKMTFYLKIVGVKKNPQSHLYTSLGVITKGEEPASDKGMLFTGTVLEVNISELGLVTQTGKVVWGKMVPSENNATQRSIRVLQSDERSWHL